MKYIFLAISLLFLPLTTAVSQSITITPDPDHTDLALNAFPVNGETLMISGDQVQIGSAVFFNPASWSHSTGREKFSFLERRENIYLISVDKQGNTLIEEALEFFDVSDETLNVYLFDDGRVVLRDNVANFSFLNSKGEQVFSVSNSSQSADGERESQLAADKRGRTVVLYNPVILYGAQTGSQARIVFGDQDHELFFDDREREIKFLQVSNDGAFITMIASDGNTDRVLIFDRFGNEIYRQDADDPLAGAVLSKNAEYLTLFTSGRVQVFELLSGDVLGSASSRVSLIYAAYQPEDETVLALGGTVTNGTITNPTLTAVHLSRREIVREEINQSLSFIDIQDIEFERPAANQYRITGLNRYLNISLQF